MHDIRKNGPWEDHEFGGLIIQYYISNLGSDELKGAFSPWLIRSLACWKMVKLNGPGF